MPMLAIFYIARDRVCIWTLRGICKSWKLRRRHIHFAKIILWSVYIIVVDPLSMGYIHICMSTYNIFECSTCPCISFSKQPIKDSIKSFVLCRLYWLLTVGSSLHWKIWRHYVALCFAWNMLFYSHRVRDGKVGIL